MQPYFVSSVVVGKDQIVPTGGQTVSAFQKRISFSPGVAFRVVNDRIGYIESRFFSFCVTINPFWQRLDTTLNPDFGCNRVGVSLFMVWNLHGLSFPLRPKMDGPT
jgi:hypothetical protein